MKLKYENSTALITGASGGIGEEFARTLADKGSHVILVARGEEALTALANELHAKHGVRAEVIVADLSIPGAADKVVAEVDERGLDVDILINNAGFGTFGLLAEADPARIRDEVALNVGALTDFTTVYLARMVKKNSGTIINVASNASFQPVPNMAVYSATKAYVRSLSEALWWEARKSGVNVLALCPGPTKTEFFDIADSSVVGPLRSTRQVVATALHALNVGKPTAVDGPQNRFAAVGARFVPKRILLGIAARVVQPRK
ncbi:MAG: SDR family oxidoreductase [Gordonia sp. (in: high G+C Gram-positive bacteria)]